MNLFTRVFQFYYQGFKAMTIGKTLWIIIFIKLFIMFVVLKIFFFPNALRSYKSESEKANHVLEQLTNPK